MHTVLYRAYRPDTFTEILGQEHIVRILTNQIETDTVGHAYLFCGTRGTGKTTIARILAKGVNCLAETARPCGVCENCAAIRDGVFIDVIEIDAASNNGVDNIRELRESVMYPPAVGRKKIYIIDEAHMLSTSACNALLKTLEEPPESVIFILATTEPRKLLITVHSRCVRLDFKRVSEELLISGMERICAEIGARVSAAALKLIAVNADGSVRDGLSILEQCLAGGEKEVSREDVLALLGSSDSEVFATLTEHVTGGRVDEALMLLDTALADGNDARQFMKDWLAHYRNLMITKFIRHPEDMLNLSSENADRVRAQSETLSLAEINRAIMDIAEMAAEAKLSTQPRILAELCIVNLAAPEAKAKSNAPVAKAPEKAPKAVEITPKSNAPSAKAPDTKAPEQVPDEAPEQAPDAPPEQVSREVPEQVPDAVPDVPATEETVITPEETSEPESGDKSNTDVSAADHDALWASLFQGEDGLKGSQIVLRTGARISSLSDTECVIAVQSGAIMDLVEKNKALIESLLENRSGLSVAIRCIEEKTENNSAAKSVEELAAELGDALGIHIEIEE